MGGRRPAAGDGPDLAFVCAHAERAAAELTRRDVARALLAVSSGVALVALPALRRAMAEAGNPLSPAFWESARATLASIEAGTATFGDVRRWLEATGTEPVLLTRGSFLWADEDRRGPVAQEMFSRLVAYLEERVVSGEIDPEALLRGDPGALAAYEELQARWLGTPLPDGRVPGRVVTDEEDEELSADLDEEEAFALSELRRVLGGLPEPPARPADLARAAARLRELLRVPGYPGNVLRACAGFDEEPPPAGDADLWLSVLAGIAGPVSDLPEADDTLEEFTDLDRGLSEEDTTLAGLCAIQHADWLAAVTALVRFGPGVLATPERIARLVAESEDVGGDVGRGLDEIEIEIGDLGVGWDDDLDDTDDDLHATEVLFGPVVALWGLLGVVDDDEVLTPLGWWGLPKALERAWSPPG
ncbi:hypothetical protein [Nonomuraea pusilla]|uniref:Uncharacterized protein n=1 Tax=Nonomuraea pusilla TaxID=46177 RepID=A0A1H7GQV1_9ACTN|nr:hypothetical protein [Nonomuraea pusilla]SEK39382.1 hypothetical protein SAMN05660976_00438 [Nonomuraea pusilla]